MYKVIKMFDDLQDNNHRYNVGDTYPRKDLKPTEDRIAELAGSENRQGTPLIKEAEKPFDKMTVEELKKYAEDNSIDLQGAEKKADILAKIKENAAN